MEGGAKGAPVKNASVARKLQKVLDITIDDHFRDSLEYLSSFYTENTAKERKNLRGLLEHRSLMLHETFLQDFDKVNELFEATEKDVDELAQLCEGMGRQLQEAHQAAADLLGTATVLQAELQDVKEREAHVQQFLQKYQLTPEERAHLKGDVTPDFFATLAKVQNIHKNCKDLLNVSHQQAGIEIMEEMYMYQLSGYERLFKYAHKLCLEVMVTDAPEMSTNFITALDTLKERPALWQQCLQEVAKGRRTAVVRTFFDALSAGTRPIDAHASDALRYVGDMLAWIHQSAAEEHELLRPLFERKAPVVFPEAEGDAEDMTQFDLMDQVFEGLAKHLKVRIEQVLKSAAGSQVSNLLVLFKLENLLEYYSQTIPTLVGPNAALSVLLQDLKLSTMKAFFELLKSVSSKLQSEPLEVTNDLAAPALVHDMLGKLTAMMDTLATSFIPKEEREAEFSHVLTAIVDPLVTLCRDATGRGPSTKALFVLNCLYTIQTTLSGYSFAKSKVDQLVELLDEQARGYAEQQASAFLSELGIAAQLREIRQKPTETPLSSLALTSEAAMAESCKQLYDQLAQRGANVVPAADQILSLRVRQDVKSQVAEAVGGAYALLHAAVHEPANGYPDPLSVAPKSVSAIRDMLHLIER